MKERPQSHGLDQIETRILAGILEGCGQADGLEFKLEECDQEHIMIGVRLEDGAQERLRFKIGQVVRMEDLGIDAAIHMKSIIISELNKRLIRG